MCRAPRSRAGAQIKKKIFGLPYFTIEMEASIQNFGTEHSSAFASGSREFVARIGFLARKSQLENADYQNNVFFLINLNQK